MWRYLPPALLMVCSALVLIAGATGDMQFWSDSVESLPSWRSVVESRSWAPLTGIWDSGMALLRHQPAEPGDHATATAIPPAIVPGAAAAPAQAAPAPAMTPAPTRQSSIAAPAPASANAALPAAAAALDQRASSPLQQRLMHARQALAAGRPADARKMLESARAEMALRTTLRESNAAQFDMSGTWLEHALLSLKSGDSSGALHDLDLAINSS
jgi:hypothetical protein